MPVHMMITHHARSARGRPLQRAGAASRSRVRSLVGFGDKDLDEVVACSIEGPEVQRAGASKTIHAVVVVVVLR